MKHNYNASEKMKCPYCNEFVPKTKYCISCGNILQDQSTAKEKNETYITPTKKSDDDLLSICPLCRNEIPKQHNFCHLCGGKLKKKSLDDQKQSIICNRCWKQNPPNIDYCIHCGMKQQAKKSKLLERTFEGYQMDLSDFFQTKPFPITMIKQALMTSSPIFPSKSTIVHSNYFGVYKSRMNAVNKLYRNFGGFNTTNLFNYLITFILMIFIYFFWFSSRYAPLIIETDIITDGFFILFFGGIVMTTLLMLPVWLSTFLVYRNTGFRLNFRIESSRVFTTIIFNLLWMFFGYGPIFLRLGEFEEPKKRIVSNKSFIKGISIGSIMVVSSAILFAILSIAVVGIPGEFVGFLFVNSPLKSHIITSYFGSIWISIILLFPLGDYYDKVIKQWNQIVYFILLSISFFLLLHSFNLMSFLEQIV